MFDIAYYVRRKATLMQKFLIELAGDDRAKTEIDAICTAEQQVLRELSRK